LCLVDDSNTDLETVWKLEKPPCPFDGCNVCEENLEMYQELSDGTQKRIEHLIRDEDDALLMVVEGKTYRLDGVVITDIKHKLIGNEVITERRE